MTNGNKKKGPTRKGPARKEPVKEPANIWVKYGAMFCIIIMVGAAMVGIGYFIVDYVQSKTTDYPFSKVGGIHSDFTFTNIIDGAKYVPEDALSIHIVVVKEDDVLSEGIQEFFPGAQATKTMTVSYASGGLEYYSLNSEENVSMIISGSKPKYENYSGYHLISSSPAHRAVVGKTPIIATFFNPSINSTLGKKAIDVLVGDAPGSSDFDEILAYADNVSNFEESIVYTANSGSNYSQYYQRSSLLNNNSSFQFEAIFSNPTDQMKEEIQELADNTQNDVTYTISQDNNMIKIYIESSEYYPFLIETWNFNYFIGDHTAT